MSRGGTTALRWFALAALAAFGSGAFAQSLPVPTRLPGIEVSAKRNTPRVSGAKPAPAPAQRAPAAAPPLSYATGAPNVAGGPPIAPSAASQMTVTGQDLNARPVTRPGEVLEAAPGLAMGMPATLAVCQNGVMDYVLHPMEPLAVRLTVARSF